MSDLKLEHQLLEKIKDPLESMFIIAKISGESHSEEEYQNKLKQEIDKVN